MDSRVYFIKLKGPWRVDPFADPPLGLLSIMASAKNLSFKGKSLDLKFLDLINEPDIPKADIYGISACTLDYSELLNVTKQIKQKYNSLVIVGGPHFDAIPASQWGKEINNLPIDIICRGEGEDTFPKALKYLENGREKEVISQEPPFLKLDSLPFPAMEFLNRELYFKPGRAFGKGVFSKGNSTVMMTSRGCPYNCSFCASPILHHRKVRYRSVENVKKELDILKKGYNVTEIRFQDDCFSINPRFKELSDMLSESNIRYRCSMRTNNVSDEILNMLWNSGCREIGFGIESAEPAVLEISSKATTVEQNMGTLKRSKAKGFKTRVFVMTGLPGETKYSAQKMIDFLEEAKPDVVTLNSFMPFPGCDIYNNPEKYGVKIHDTDWDHYNIFLMRKEGFPFPHTISTATPEELERNRELLKEYTFNRKLSNVKEFNTPYHSSILHENKK